MQISKINKIPMCNTIILNKRKCGIREEGTVILVLGRLRTREKCSVMERKREAAGEGKRHVVTGTVFTIPVQHSC